LICGVFFVRFLFILSFSRFNIPSFPPQTTFSCILPLIFESYFIFYPFPSFIFHFHIAPNRQLLLKMLLMLRLQQQRLLKNPVKLLSQLVLLQNKNARKPSLLVLLLKKNARKLLLLVKLLNKLLSKLRLQLLKQPRLSKKPKLLLMNLRLKLMVLVRV